MKDRGLVVITSCGHVGILNTIRQAQEVSGIKKLHALIGGFHLGPATPDYTDQVVAELKTFAPDVVVPMHCSGQTFVDLSRRSCRTGSCWPRRRRGSISARDCDPAVLSRSRGRSPAGRTRMVVAGTIAR